MNVITYDVYKNTVKKHDGFNPVTSEKNYTKLQFRFQKDDDWEKCTLVTASFWLSNDNIVKSDVELLSDNLTATFDIPPEFSGIKGALKVGLQGKCGNAVIIATNIITLNRNNGVIVTEGANATLYEKIIDLVDKYFKDDKAIIDSFIEYVNSALSEKADKAKSLDGYGITDGENNNNKVKDKSKITDENTNYPSIAYLLRYYYDFDDINEFLEDKVNINDFEKVSSAFDAVPSVNLFNPVNVINANIDATNKVIVSSPTSRLGYVKCEPNTVYTVVRNEPLSSRFYIGTTNDEPTSDTPVTIIKTDSSLTSLTFTTDSTANYIVFYFYIQKSDGEYNQSFAENIMIAEGEVAEYVPYEEKQILKENNLPPIIDERLTNIEKVSSAFDEFSSANLFNPENVISANIDGTNKVIVASPTSRLGYVKCEPNTVYTVLRNEPLSSRFYIGTTSTEPTSETPVTIIKTDSSLTSLTFTTDSSANYIVFYFYIQKSDGEYNQSFAENIMIAEGEVAEYVPYEEKQILKENNLPPIVDERLTNVENIISNTAIDNRFTTKSKIYGVTFNNSDTSSVCQRIGNAVGLKTDYVVGDDFQNGGKNDFDNIFPWCDIRRCNLTVDADGKKTITYESEAGFATDGSNGNVMVEIPKFYSYREVLNGSEIWAITGEPKSGFTVEPAFIGNDGKELDYIYVGAYQFSGKSSETDIHSKSNEFVFTGIKLTQYRNAANKVNMQCLDFAVVHALQMLFVIEFADRDTDKYMQGVSYLPWFSSSNSPISAISNDRRTVTVSKVNRVANLRAEQNVMICRGTKKQENLTITAIAENTDNTVSITLDTAVTSEFDISAGNVYIAGQAQKTGLCDTLSYHTGRLSEENALSPFRYRWIENIWGNAWEILEGIRVKELEYYYTFNPAQYADDTIDNWSVSQIIAPNQPYLGDDSKNRAWISTMGYDVNDRQIILPFACSTDGSTDKYYSSALYTQYDVDKSGTALDTSTEYLCVFGGGYDHNTLCGLFTMRFWFADGKESSSLHTSRLIYRGSAANSAIDKYDSSIMTILGGDSGATE